MTQHKLKQIALDGVRESIAESRLDVAEHFVRALEQLCDDDLSRKELAEAYDIAMIADLPRRH
jgi:hypothetical protein